MTTLKQKLEEYVKSVHIGGADPYPLTVFEREIEAFERKAFLAGAEAGFAAGRDGEYPDVSWDESEGGWLVFFTYNTFNDWAKDGGEGE